MEPSAVSENPDITSVDNDNSTHNVQITNHIIGQEQFSCNPSHIVIQERKWILMNYHQKVKNTQ